MGKRLPEKGQLHSPMGNVPAKTESVFWGQGTGQKVQSLTLWRWLVGRQQAIKLAMRAPAYYLFGRPIHVNIVTAETWVPVNQ